MDFFIFGPRACLVVEIPSKLGHPVRVNENGITATLKEFFVFFFIVIIFYRYFTRSVRIFNFLPLKMKAPDRKIG